VDTLRQTQQPVGGHRVRRAADLEIVVGLQTAMKLHRKYFVGIISRNIPTFQLKQKIYQT